MLLSATNQHVGWKTSSMLGANKKPLHHSTSSRLQKYCYLGKTCLNCKSGIFQFKGQSASLCAATDVVVLEEADLIFRQHRWRCSLAVKSHSAVSPVIERNKAATHHTAFQAILFLLHLLSHDPLCLCSHIALGFTHQCQGVSIFPGESRASGRECGPVTPAGRADQEFTVVLTAGLRRPN